MVFKLPNEADLRVSKTYTELFYLTLIWNIGLLAICVAVLFLIFYILKKYQLRTVQNKLLRDTMITVDIESSRRTH
jgi:hypothetical protein